MKQDHAKGLETKIATQRWSQWFEQFWHALQAPLWIGLAFLSLAFSGLMQFLAHGLQLAVLLGFGLGFAASCYKVLKLQKIARSAALRRMEIASELHSRELSSLDDALTAQETDPQTAEIWAAHRQKLSASAVSAKISPPLSAWAQFDPKALRVPIALCLVASIFLGQGSLRGSFERALPPSGQSSVATLSIDAWLKPPAYTGKAPVLLTSAARMQELKAGAELLVPENSVLSLRVRGAANPKIAFYSLGTELALKAVASTSTASDQGFLATATLDRPALVKLLDGDTVLAEWPITLIPDAAPTISLNAEPTQENLGTWVLNWLATDDYGLKSVTAEISLADEQDDGTGFESNGVFLFDPPTFPIALKKLRSKSEEGVSRADLTAHPWAGLRVELTLTVLDEAGKLGTITQSSVKLPERAFYKPAAKAIIEQRKVLIMKPERLNEVADLFDALLTYPEGVMDRSGQILNLAAITSRLRNFSNQDDIIAAIDQLWLLALDIEEGGLADARAELQALKKELERAIAEGADPERIAQLMEKMREAMQRYMEAMRDEAQKRGENKSSQQPPGESQEITEQDLAKMLETIEKLAQNGAKDAAQELLAQLNELLQNMEPGGSQQSGEGDEESAEMLDALSDLMKRQQNLMGETQGEPEPGDGQQSDRGEGQKGRNGSRSGEDLAQEQRQLRETLDRMMRGNQGDMPQALGEAGRRMGEAEQSLQGDDREKALTEQGEAMDQMREGAKKLAQQGQERRGQGQARRNGRDGEANGDDLDPLGRPRASKSTQNGPKENMIPSELAIRRAREILDQLRGKANEGGTDTQELNYIERLLRGIY